MLGSASDSSRTPWSAVAVDDQVVRIERLDEFRDTSGPRRRGVEFVPSLPAEDRRIVAVRDAGARVDAGQDVPHRRLEVGDHLLVGPKRLGRLAAERRILADAALPFPVVDQRDDEPHAVPVRRCEREVERAERFFVELAGPADVDVVAHVGPLAANAEDVRPRDRAAHLPDGRERIVEFELVRPGPGRFGSGGKVVFNELEIGDVEGDKAERFVAVVQLVAPRGDETVKFAAHGRSRPTGQREEHECDQWNSHDECSPLAFTSLSIVLSRRTSRSAMTIHGRSHEVSSIFLVRIWCLQLS